MLVQFMLIIYADTVYARTIYTDIKFFHQLLYFFNIIVGDAFIAKPGCTLIVADYGQLELRYDTIYFLKSYITLFFQIIFSNYFFNLFFQFIFLSYSLRLKFYLLNYSLIQFSP